MPGESARQEYERLRRVRTTGIRQRLPVLVGLSALLVGGGAALGKTVLGNWWIGALPGLLAAGSMVAPTQREAAWRKGAEGEQAVARALDRLGPSSFTLHDRLIPGSRANIDHILVAPTGVWTVDAKNYTGRIEVRRRGQELWVNGRDRSKLLEQAQRQASVVRTTLADAGIHRAPVKPALCFVGAEWPVLFRPRAAARVQLTTPRGLRKLIEGQAMLSANELENVRRTLDRALPPARKQRRGG